jgi:5'(3')-deoxyribonucleotidase
MTGKQISCHLMGGLGNQMFQVATTVSHGKKIGFEAVFSPTTDLGCSRKKSYTTNVLRKIKRIPKFLGKWNVFRESNHRHQILPTHFEHNVYLDGYFQSYKYFDDDKEFIKNLFEIDEDTRKFIYNKYGPILKGNTTSIHVRRGDYIGLGDIHYNQPLSYYEKALTHVKDDTDTFLIFSDDIEWCKSTPLFMELKNVVFIDEEDYISLYMMTMCKNNIITNSSFSWWGAYLKVQDGKVISPQIWFGPKGPTWNINDIIPLTWMLL